MGDDSKVQVQGKGVVSVDTKFGKKLVQKVMYVPELTQNLISLGQLMKMAFMLSLMVENACY